MYLPVISSGRSVGLFLWTSCVFTTWSVTVNIILSYLIGNILLCISFCILHGRNWIWQFDKNNGGLGPRLKIGHFFSILLIAFFRPWTIVGLLDLCIKLCKNHARKRANAHWATLSNVIAIFSKDFHFRCSTDLLWKPNWKPNHEPPVLEVSY